MAPPRATQPLRLCLVLAAVSALGNSEYNRACCWRTTRCPVPCLVVLRLRGGEDRGRAEAAPLRERASAQTAAKLTKQAKTRKRSMSPPRAVPTAADGDDEEKLRASLQGELAAVFGDMTALSPRLLLCCVVP